MLLRQHVEHFCDLRDAEENHAYARMIDGRTIHQFFQFVRPLVEQCDPPSFTEDQLLSCSGTMSRLSRLASAVHQVDMLGFTFILELAVARSDLIRLSEMRRAHASHKNTLCVEVSLIEMAAASVFTKFALADEAAQKAGQRQQETVEILTQWCKIFKESVREEYCRRRAQCKTFSRRHLRAINFPSPDELLALLDSISGFCLTAELVAYWFPLWQRSQFIFDSPFDTATDLVQIYSKDKSELSQ